MAWTDICAEAAVPDDGPHIVTVEGKEIGLLRWRSEIFAVRNRCSHAGAPIAQGRIFPRVVVAKPGDPADVDPERPELRCPWHHWGFDLATGVCTAPVRRPRLKVYPLEIRDGRVWLDL